MRTADLLAELKDCAVEEIETPVCRAFVHPGPEAPFDVCSKSGDNDGQLWVANVLTTQGWPEPDDAPTRCNTMWTDVIELGIVRCANGVVKDNGDPPDAADVTADATQQQTDKVALRRAILCCFDVEGSNIVVAEWRPVAPEGGCVGGIWTIRSADSGCDCVEDS